MTTSAFSFQTAQVNGFDIFYREVGDPARPTLLLLHGFPSSSHMYRDLMTNLADQYHLIAPDYPGFGNSSSPTTDTFVYTFDNLSVVMEKFIDAIGLSRFSLFVQDYGGPIGFRIAARRPELVQALLIQNANAYLDGIGPALEQIPAFWAGRNAETETPLRWLLSLEGTKFQYLDGVPNSEKINPDAYQYDQLFLDRPGNVNIQLDLLFDYQHNIARYEEWHTYFRQYQPPTLLTWGKHDQFFVTAGAEAYRTDLPDAELHLLDSGHFALEDCHTEVAGHISKFLSEQGII